MSDETKSDSAAPAPAVFAGPDHRDMYLLIAGLIVGLAMCPWIAGRLMSVESFEKWYQGGGEQYDTLRAFVIDQDVRVRSEKQQKKEQLQATGVTPIAIDEAMAQIDERARAQRLPYTQALTKAHAEHQAWLVGLVSALVMAAVLLMFIEPVFEPVGRTAAIRRRLVTGRYVLLAAWIAVTLAKPTYLSGLSPTFAILLVVVALLAALLPWLLAGKE
ncbi:MAG: hypothetical protein WD768_20855 [Phycisphaeraceae bacterium]